MWFDNRKKHPDVSEEPEHWPTERMILEGHADYATPEDLEGLDDSLLVDIAMICDVDQFAPDECIPCKAHTMHLERIEEAKARLEAMNPALHEDEEFDPEGSDYDAIDTPKLDALMADEEPQILPELLNLANTAFNPETHPVEKRFAAKVEELQVLVTEMFSGPPIPPKEVDLAELGLLVLAADKWVKMTQAQGMDMSPKAKAVLDSTEALVARLRS